MQKTLFTIAFLLMMLTLAQPANAMRCGSKIITKGDHASKILQYCGEPIYVQRSYVYRPSGWKYTTGMSTGNAAISRGHYYSVRGATEEIAVEEWTYNRGRQKLIRIIRLENGRVASIDAAGYGY